MTDNAPASSHMYGVGGFGHGGVGPSYNGIGDQHASTMVRPCSDFPQYGTQYSQFGQGNIRPGYSVGPVIQKEGMIPNRQGMGWGAVNAFQAGCPPGQQQRYMPSSGMPGPQQQPPSQQQQLPPGSAPTLNQLLQSPNSDQRYPGMYGEYVSGHPKTSGAEDVVGPSGGYGVPGWAGQQRMAMGAYQQQMMCSPMAAQSSPNQGVAMYDLSRRPSMGMGSRYPPPHPPPPHHGGTALQNPSQYLSNSQPNSTLNQLGGQMQQQQQQSFSPNHSLPPAAHLQPSPSTTPQSQHSDHSSSNIKAQSSPQSMPTAKHKTKKQLKQRQQQTKPQTNVQEDSVCEDAYADSGTGHHNAGSNSLHHAVGSQHPAAAPSPAGSVGSRSNTPASLSGNMVGSPSTNQHDGQSRILSPLHSQGGSGQGTIHNSQQQPQMMPPPSMCPSHPGISSGSSKMHVPPHAPHMNAVGTSHQMTQLPYNNVHYNNVHYSSNRGPPGSHTTNMMPGYNGGHPDLINGPSNHIPGYGPSGMANRIPNYPGSYGSGIDSSSVGQFGGGYGMHPVAVAPGMSTSGAITSAAEAGYHPSSLAAERSGVNGKSSASMEDASFSSRPLSLSADVPQPSSQPMQSPLGNSMMGRTSHSSGIDGGGGPPGRNPYGMPPSYEMAGLSQQQQQHQQHIMMSFGKPFPLSMTPHPGPGAFTRDHSAGAHSEERLRPPSLTADGSDPVGNRINTSVGVSGMDGSAFLKQSYDGMSFHGDGSHPHHHPHHRSPSHGMPDGVMLPNAASHHMQHRNSEDFGPSHHPATHTNMGPPASSPYMAGDQATPFDTGKALENVPGMASAAGSAGLARDKWIKSDYSHQFENAGRNSILDRDRPRIYDEGSASDTQSSDMGPFPMMTDDSTRLTLNSGNDMSSSSGNGSLLNKTLLGSNDDAKKSKVSKSKKHKSDKVPGFVVPSPMTPVHDELDDISNASRPTTPKSEGNDVLNRLAEMGDERDRRPFLERLFAFMEENGTPIVSIPMISKTAVDLYKLYHLVREHGGMVEVTKSKKWRDVSGALNIGPSSSAGFTLKKNYGKHLFGFECRFDRGNVDPVPLLAMLEQPTKKESKKAAAERAAAAAANAQDMYRMSSGQQFGCYPGSNVHLQPGMDPGNNPMLMSSSSGMAPANPQQMPYGGPGMMHSAGPGMMPPSATMPNGGMMHPGMEGGMPTPHGMGNTGGGGPGLMPPNNGGDTISIQDPFSDVPNQVPGALHRPGLNYMGASGAGGMMAHRAMYGGVGNMLDGRSQKMPFGSPAAAAAGKSPLSSPMMGGGGSGTGVYEGSQTDSLDGQMIHDTASNSQDGFPAYCNRAPSESGSSGQRTVMDSAHLTSNRFEQQPQPQQQPLMGAGQGLVHSLHHDDQGHTDPSYYSNRQAALQQRSMIDQQVAFSHGYPGGYPNNQRILPPSGGSEKYYPTGASGMAVDAAGQQLYMTTPPGCPPLPSRRDMLTPSPQRPAMMKTELREGYSPCYDARKDQPWMTSGGHMPNYPLNYPPNAMLPGVHPPPFNHSSQLCLSPQKLDRPMCPPQPDRKVSALPSRSDIHFPPDSIEAIQPHTLKRKRYTHKQLEAQNTQEHLTVLHHGSTKISIPVDPRLHVGRDVEILVSEGLTDPWRLMMSLKSGLIVESTSALEILSILLHDDATVSWFGLQHLPGLVEVLLEHFRRCLTQIFPSTFEDLELGFETLQIINRLGTEDGKMEQGKETPAAAGAASGATTNSDVQADDKCVGLSEENNFTMKTRSGETVVIEENSPEQELVLDNKKWDVYQEVDSSLFDWQMGRGDTSIHVLTHFNPENSLEFCKTKFFGSRHPPHLLDEENRNMKNDFKAVAEKQIPDESCTKIQQDEAPVLCKTDERNGEKPAAVKIEEDSTGVSDCTGPVVSDRTTVDQMDCQKLTEADFEYEARALESMKRKWTEDEDIEVYQHDAQSLFLVNEAQTEISRRCLCISNIFRGLSFVPGNDLEMSKHAGLLLVIGKLLMLNHIHLKPSAESKKMDATDADEETDQLLIGCDSKARWSLETLEVLREDTFVIFANISGQLDLSLFPEEIVSPILNGLLHWVTCTAACAHDPLPTMPLHLSLSPRRLVLETLCKLCITDSNVDLLLAMPPYSRIVIFLSNLVQLVAESSDQVVREFAIVLISSVIQADSSSARAIALHHPSISILLDFIESADHRALQVVSTQGLAMLKDSPEMMGTSLDMLRRAAAVLRHMAAVPENRILFARFHHRLLHLVMSQIMDQKVATTLAEVLFHSSLS